MARIITVTIAIVILLFGWFTYRCFKNNESGVPHMLILSGAVSNLWDRIFHPGVIDFIILSVGSYSWPTFNIADVAIVSGILLLAYKTYHTE